MPEVLEVAEALAEALTAVSPSLVLTVEPRMVFTPAGPCIDIYPADPAEEDSAFGPGSRLHWFVVRMRVFTADADAMQDLLYAARNTSGSESIREALLADATDLDGVADGVVILGPSGFQLYEDVTSGAPKYLGQEWRVGVHVSEDGAT